MNSEIETKLRKIEKMSIWLRAGCTVLLALTAIAFIIVTTVVLVGGRGGNFNYFDESIPISELTVATRLIVAVVCLLTGVAFAKGLYHVRRLLDNYTRREIFTTDSSEQIRKVGLTCIFWGVVKIMWVFLPLLVLPHASYKVMVPLDALVMGAVIVVISWFTKMATILREENELTV
jgi:hypothetical protein